MRVLAGEHTGALAAEVHAIDEFGEDAAHREEIGGGRGLARPTEKQLRCDVVAAAEQLIDLGEIGVGNLGQPEVDDAAAALVVDQDVPRLQIAMNHALLVDAVQARQDLRDDVDHIVHAQAVRLGVAVQRERRPIGPPDQLHDVVVERLFAIDGQVATVLEHLDDVGVVDLAQDARLADEAANVASILDGEIGIEDLDRVLGGGVRLVARVEDGTHGPEIHQVPELPRAPDRPADEGLIERAPLLHGSGRNGYRTPCVSRTRHPPSLSVRAGGRVKRESRCFRSAGRPTLEAGRRNESIALSG